MGGLRLALRVHHQYRGTVGMARSMDLNSGDSQFSSALMVVAIDRSIYSLVSLKGMDAFRRLLLASHLPHLIIECHNVKCALCWSTRKYKTYRGDAGLWPLANWILGQAR